MTNNARPVVSGTALIWAIAAMFIAVVGAVCVIAVAVPDSQNPAGLIGLLLGAFATLVVNIGVLFQLSQVKRNVDYLANGGTDSKVRAAIADVVDDQFLRDDAEPQLTEDRLHRDHAPKA